MLSRRNGKIEAVERRILIAASGKTRDGIGEVLRASCCRAFVASPRCSVAANNKLTLDVLRGHLSCPYLAHLLLTGQEGVKSDYELVLAELEQALRPKVTAELHTAP